VLAWDGLMHNILYQISFFFSLSLYLQLGVLDDVSCSPFLLYFLETNDYSEIGRIFYLFLTFIGISKNTILGGNGVMQQTSK